MTDLSVSVQPPQQERSRASFERVLQAATSLLAEEGYDGFTLAEVSKRAGVSIGSIYARVKSKDDLFYVLQDRYMTGAEDRPMLQDAAAWSELSAPELVRELVREFGEVFHQNEPLLRVFMHRGIVDPTVAARSSVSVSRSTTRSRRSSSPVATRSRTRTPSLRSTSRSAWRGGRSRARSCTGRRSSPIG